MEKYWVSHLEALAATDQPEAGFRSLEAIATAHVGALLFTAMIHDLPNQRSRRIYSNRNDVYPAGGWKNVQQTRYSRTVLETHQPFVNRNIDDVREVFFDHELIQSLGCESSCHVPIVVAGELIGVINMLHGSEYYTEDRLQRALELRPFAMVPVLLARRHYALEK